MKNTQKRKLPPDPDKMNNQRANAAGFALECFADDFGESWKNKSAMVRKQLRSQNLGDLLTDFAHLCDREGFNMAVHFAAARHRYDEETEGKGTQFAPPTPPAPAFDDSELATILAALRLFQRTYKDVTGRDIAEAWPEHFEIISPDDDGYPDPPPLGTDDIDALCERLNLAPETTREANPETVNVIVVVEGGAVQDILADAPVRVAVIDYDTDGAEPGDLTAIPVRPAGETADAFASMRPVDIAPARVRELLEAIEGGPAVTAPAVTEAQAGLIPHDPQDDEPDVEDTENPLDVNEPDELADEADEDNKDQTRIKAAYRNTARENYGGGDPITVDGDAQVSISTAGAYVTAAIWITKEEAGLAS